ncbi:hypothetical protein LZ554_004109 [Drepanopeziza brunnea f. sp. 'monogermtubi']|nr:hypothetical protein LZ554_004109 [Drepanopeziza brunnea f. sp. 'monogermtubi']
MAVASLEDQVTLHGDKTNGDTNHGPGQSLAIELSQSRGQMSILHEGAFIITICMAQILVLSGLGKGLGRLGDMYGHKKIFLVGAICHIFPVFLVAMDILGMGIVLFAYTATSFLILPPDEHDFQAEASKPAFDFAGTITGVTGLILFNFAWNQAGVVGWTVPYTYVLTAVGILFFAAFFYVEKNVARYPLVSINSLSKEALYALSTIACGWASFGIWVYYIWKLIENLRPHSILSAAVQQSPGAISGLFASLVVGYLFSSSMWYISWPRRWLAS